MITTIRLVKIHLLQNFTWKRTLPVLILLSLFIFQMTIILREISTTWNLNWSYGIIPLYFGHNFYVSIVALAMIILFNHLPFDNTYQSLLKVRCGRSTWLRSQIFYILFAAAIFVIIYNFLVIIFLAPHIEFRETWGKLIKSIAMSVIDVQMPLMLNPGLIMSTSPLNLTIKFNVIFYLTTVLFGLINLSFNLLVRGLGTIISGAMIVVHLLIYIQNGLWVQFFSPLSWLNFNYISYEARSALWSFEQIVVILFVLILLLLLIIERPFRFLSYRRY